VCVLLTAVSSELRGRGHMVGGNETFPMENYAWGHFYQRECAGPGEDAQVPELRKGLCEGYTPQRERHSDGKGWASKLSVGTQWDGVAGKGSGKAGEGTSRGSASLRMT
jgi:hypothetical protein